MSSVLLSDIAGRLGLAAGSDTVRLTGLAIDSRAVQPGDAFVAIRGTAADGNDFIDGAIERGARAIISEAIVTQSIPSLRVTNTQAACAAFASAARSEFVGRTVGITGSAGKTTAKTFLSSICSLAGSTVSTAGNQNNELGVPLTLSKLLADPEFAVVEMGASQPGDIDYLTGLVKPSVVILLNALEAHVGRFGSLDAIVQTKGEILDGLSPEDTAVLNADQPSFTQWKARANPAAIFAFGKSEQSDIRLIERVSRGFSGSDVVFEYRSKPHRVRLQIPGAAGVTNALAAAAAAYALGIESEQIIEGLEQVGPVSGRGNTVQLGRGIRVIDETYNASPSSVMAVIAVLAETKPPRTLVLGDMLELGDSALDYHRKVGQQVSDLGIERLISVGDIAGQVSRACTAQTEHFAHVDDLLASQPQFAANETILVKGSRAIGLDRFVRELSVSQGETAC